MLYEKGMPVRQCILLYIRLATCSTDCGAVVPGPTPLPFRPVTCLASLRLCQHVSMAVQVSRSMKS